MNDSIISMIERRRPETRSDWDRALREVLQETALVGLWRTGFFDKVAFYGGTALRLFYNLDRFSEDLDFTLVKPEPNWKLSDRLSGLQTELEAFGFSVEMTPKHEGSIESAFIKANTKINLINIKLETDTDPPQGIRTENKTLFEPFPVSIRVAVPSCLFAGKMHACLCRSWKTRIKGRDWYDLLFFVSRSIPVDLTHLETRMRQSGHWDEVRSLEADDARNLLKNRIQSIDWQQAKADVLPFLRIPQSLNLWGIDLFNEAVQRIEWEKL